MAWERGYYYRVRKVNGRVVREYVGKGYDAELVAQIDEGKRGLREYRALRLRQQKAELAALAATVKSFCETVDLVARAALLAAGFRQHKRGEWRKQRERTKPT